MCIFSTAVQVSGTNILVSLANKGARQFTAYQNHVKTKVKNNNAMILPLPLVKGEKVDLIDLSNYSELFEDCSKAFLEPEVLTNSSRSRGWSDDNYLEVKQVGGYKVSVAENIDEILKINPKVFTLPKDIHQLFSKHYSTGYAFAVCLFDSNVTDPHAIAFEHSIIGKDKLYVPTRHEHGNHSNSEGTTYKIAYYQGDLPKGESNYEKSSNYAQWDHMIYSTNAKNGGNVGPKEPRVDPSKIFSKLPKNLDQVKSFHRLVIHGKVQNDDVIINTL